MISPETPTTAKRIGVYIKAKRATPNGFALSIMIMNQFSNE